MNEKQGFGQPTFMGPQEAFLASTMANAGVPWPRKPLSGKPQLTKGKGGKSRGGKSHSVRLRKTY